MSKLNKVLAGFVAVILIVIIGVALKDDSTETSLGSISVGSSYQSTTTYSNGAAVTPNWRVIKEGQGVFGSVVITGATAGTMRFYDATSTVTNTEWPTTTLAVFPASTAVGTYTFDSNFFKGLLVEFSSLILVPTTTVTFRP